MKRRKRVGKRQPNPRPESVVVPRSTAEFDAAMISGTLAGAAVGAIAGPPGLIAGSLLGAAAGIAAGAVLQEEGERRHRHDEELDEAIGVYSGPIGAAPPDQPPARIGAFSSASAGASAPPSSSSEGPIQAIDEE